MYKKYFKRLLDIVFSLILLIVLFPLFIMTGIICFIVDKQVFYLQKRDGLNKKSFTIYKFCSMKNIEGNYLERTVPITRFIRNIGLDELPQLINILKGDMSFIGPRPFITGEPLPSKPKDIIYTVRPGVISLAISKGRRDVTYSNRLKYDEEYVLNVTFKNDILILFRTFNLLIKQNFKR